MDKETLSNYGWIVICTLVLAVMIALATPFGEYISAGVWSTTNGLNDTLNKNMEIAGLSGSSDDNPNQNQPTTPLHFGEKYIITESNDDDLIMTVYYIFYEDGSATVYNGEDTITLPAGSFEYTETEIKPTDGSIATIIENGTKFTVDGLTATLESELPDGYATFTDGTMLSWTELKTKYSVTDTAVNNNAFADNPTIKSIVIPNSVTTIGSYAFDGCGSLTNITIPKSVTTINRLAFRSCKKLTSVTIPDSITSMGSDAFYNCSSLTCVYITDLTAWCNISFGGISANPLLYAKNLYLNGKLIKDLVIPSEITAIKNYTFNGGSFTSITIPNTVTSIGSYAFYNCQSLPNITIPNSVTSIETYAFAGCKSLKSVVLSNIITTIPAYAFDGCSSLSNITIPNTVTSIGAYAFNNCSSLTDIIIPNGVTSLGSYAFSNSGVTSVVIPTSVTSIGSYAFDGCSSLTNITIPKSVTTINPFTFRSCTKLQTVTFNGTISEWNAVTKGSNWKYRVPTTATVICSDGTVAL